MCRPAAAFCSVRTLKLYALTATVPGIHAVAKVDDNTWTETGITWNNKPAAGNPYQHLDARQLTPPAARMSPAPSPRAASFPSKSMPPRRRPMASSTTAPGKTAPPPIARNSASPTATRRRKSASPRPPTATSSPMPEQVTITADAIATDGAVTSVAFYDGATLLGTDTVRSLLHHSLPQRRPAFPESRRHRCERPFTHQPHHPRRCRLSARGQREHTHHPSGRARRYRPQHARQRC